MLELRKRLKSAAFKNDLAFIAEATKAGPIPADDLGEAMVDAAEYGHIAVVRKLAECGADIDHATKQGRTVIYWASRSANQELLQFALDSGANPDAADNYGIAALTALVWSWSVDGKRDKSAHPWAACFSMLLSRGANPDHPNKEGKTPRQLATERFKMELDW